MGRKVSSAELASGNIALVQISATLPPFAHHGTKIDVDVASIGEASSLRGGRLVLSELRGPDGKIYALASGSLVIGGFEASGAAAKTTKGVPTFGSIPGGAVCEPPVEELQTRLLNDAGDLELMLPALSSRSIVDARDAIQTMLAKAGIGFCSIAGPNLLRVSLDDAHQRRDKLLGVLANIEDLHIRPDPRSRIDINERTGVVVIGKGVRLSPCLLAVDDLTITVIEDERVSQPGNIGSEEAPGETVVTPQTTIIREQDNRQATLGGEANLQDLLTALRALGLKGQQLIPVLKELHRSGNLHGEMVSR
jgi:flagellar P-ring protein precursor FlgI